MKHIPHTLFFFLHIRRLIGALIVLCLLACFFVMMLGKLLDSDLIAYIGPRPNTLWGDNRFAINLYDTRTNLNTPLTSTAIYPQLFSWSPNASYIATIARRYGGVDNTSGLYVLRANGHAPQRVSGDLIVVITTERPPYWTEDSQYLIFQATHGANNIIQFYRASLDGSPPELMDLSHPHVQGYIEGLFPPYYIAPNGRFHAYVDYQNSQWALMVAMDGQRRAIRTFTSEQIMPDAPDWAWDSARIAFSQREGRIPTIWILSLQGETLFRIAQGRAPLWKPKSR